MDLRHFNLREQPFGVTPDSRFLLATETHREALAALLFGIESGVGFMTLIASPGMGKTTILFETLARLRERARTVFLFQTIQNPIDLVRALLIDLGEKDPQGSLVDLETRLNEILVRESEMGKCVVVVIDEAQNLSYPVLEAVRMLSNFETASRKLVQIVLCGQPQLADRLAEPQLLQLRQRISIFARLEPLKPFETAQYIEHRLKVAGYIGSKPLFTKEAVDLIARHSDGIPRNINNLCFNALSIALALKKSVIGADTVREVIDDLSLRREESVERITITRADRAQVSPGITPLGQAWFGLRVASIAAALCAIAVAALVTNPVQQPAAAQSSPSIQPSTPLQAQPENAALDSPIPAHTSGEPHRGEASALSRDRPAQMSHEVRLVEVNAGESLSAICTEQFGECRPSMLGRIIELNPQIADPDIIQMGEKVVVPATDTPPAGRNQARTGD
jgi:general secretion pathway protein A